MKYHKSSQHLRCHRDRVASRLVFYNKVNLLVQGATHSVWAESLMIKDGYYINLSLRVHAKRLNAKRRIRNEWKSIYKGCHCQYKWNGGETGV